MAAKIVEHLMKGGFGIPNLSFLQLANNLLMHKTMWSHEFYQLYTGYPRSQPIEAKIRDKWGYEDAHWNVPEMAKRGLVTWDGKGNMGDFISRNFGVVTSIADQMRYMWSLNPPVVIRVHYRAPAVDLPDFSHLRKIKINGLLRELGGNEYKMDSPEVGSRTWVLIMVVRLRKGDEGGDYIRRYSLDGKEMLPPYDYIEGDNSWRLGEPGREYMLFYTRGPDRDLVRGGLPEVAYRPRAWAWK